MTIIRAVCLLFFALSFHLSFAFGGGSIMGRVTDPETKKPVDGATVVLECQGIEKIYFTNESGYFYASNIPPGIYKITVSYMSNKSIIPEVKIANDEEREVSIALSTSVSMNEIVFRDYQTPLVDAFNPEGGVIPREEFTFEPIINSKQPIGILPAVVDFNGEYYVRGARAGSLSYYIDGCRVMGNPDIPLCGLDTYRSYLAFVPAKYGDATGGVIVMETRNFFGE